MNAELIVFQAGTIRDLFAPWRSASVKKGLNNTPTKTVIDGQCVHVTHVYDEQADASYYERCMNDAEVGPTHGWLCKEHQGTQTYPKSPFRGSDSDIVGYIKLTEEKALKTIKREVVGKIQFVEGLRMTYDPETYAKSIKE